MHSDSRLILAKFSWGPGPKELDQRQGRESQAKEAAMQKVRMIAQGRVQGVGFRWGVYSLALEIGGIAGRVWNNDDGTVEILAQAESSADMAKFIQEIRKGPTPFSRVSYLDVTMANFDSYSDFKIAN